MNKKSGKYCELCKESFPSTRRYIEHYATVKHIVCLRDKHRNLEKDFCIFCQRFYDTIDTYANHLKTELHVERIKVFRLAIKEGNNEMEQLIAMNVIAMPPVSFLKSNQRYKNSEQSKRTSRKIETFSNVTTSTATTPSVVNVTTSSASIATTPSGLKAVTSASNITTTSLSNVTTPSDSKAITSASNVTTTSSSALNATAIAPSKATTTAIGEPPSKVTKVQPKIDLTKMKRSRLDQLAIKPKSREDEMIVEQLIREHAKNVREKEIAERLGPSMENLIKEATASSILNLLKEQGICSDLINDPVSDTMEPNELLPMANVVNHGIVSNEQNETIEDSRNGLNPVTIKAEVIDLESSLEVKQEPMETTANWIEELNRHRSRENTCGDIIGSAKFLELTFESEQIQSQLDVVDRQIAKCIDLRLYLLRKRQFLNSEINLHLNETCYRIPEQELTSFGIPPHPPTSFTPILPVPVIQPTIDNTLPIEENVTTLSNNETPQQMETEDIVLVSDEPEVEMLSKSLSEPKRKKKRIEFEVSTLVTVEPKTDLNKNISTPTRQWPISNTSKPAKETKTDSEVANRSSEPALAVSAAQTQTKLDKNVSPPPKLQISNSSIPLKEIEGFFEISKRSSEPSLAVSIPQFENEREAIKTKINGSTQKSETKRDETISHHIQRKETENALEKKTENVSHQIFVDLSKIRRLQIRPCNNEVVIMKGYSEDVFICSSDGFVKRFQLLGRPNSNFVYISQYVHDSNQVCGMELLPMKTGFFLIIANKSGVLQKFHINSKWCFASVNTRVRVTCTTLRWNILFLGTIEGTILTYCAIKLELKSSYVGSKTSITCLATELEGACRLLYVGSLEQDVSVRVAHSGLIQRFIVLEPTYYPRKMQIVKDMMFTLVISKVKRDVEKIYIHRHVNGQILYLIENVNGIQCMSVSENKTLVFSDRYHNLYRFDYDTKKVVKLGVRSGKGPPPTLIFVHNNLLLTGTRDGRLECWMDASIGDKE